MKPFNPIALNVRNFGKFFALAANHFSIADSETGERKQVILIQMPREGVMLTGMSKAIDTGANQLHQFEIYRSLKGTTTRNAQLDHLLTISSVHITHPQPCVVIDSVDFNRTNNPAECADDLTTMADNERQGLIYARALRRASFLHQLTAIAGRKPEEASWLREDDKQKLAQLALPYTALCERMDEMPLPPDYPRRGDVTLKEVPRDFRVESLREEGDEEKAGTAATAQKAEGGSTIYLMPDAASEDAAGILGAKPSRPAPPQGGAEVVRLDAFRRVKRTPSG